MLLLCKQKCLLYFDVSCQLKAPFLIKSFTSVYENDLGEVGTSFPFLIPCETSLPATHWIINIENIKYTQRDKYLQYKTNYFFVSFSKPPVSAKCGYMADLGLHWFCNFLCYLCVFSFSNPPAFCKAWPWGRCRIKVIALVLQLFAPKIPWYLTAQSSLAIFGTFS